MVYYGGGGVEDGRAVQVVGGASDSSSEESRNSYYPYDQGQLEIEAKALSGNGTVGNDAQPKPLQRPASFRDRPSPAYPSPAAPASSGGVDKGRGTGRESKRLSRQTPASSSAGDVFARGGAQARSASDVLGRGRPQARSVNDVLAREAPQEPSASDVLAHGRPPKQSSGNGGFARGRSQERQSNVGLAAAARAPRAEFSPSPPPSAPAGRLADRIRTLRERCCLGLGEGTFERAYRYLKAQEESDALAWGAEVAVEEDREERLVRELTDILGQNKVHYYSLIDQLIFIENTLTGPA